MSLSRTCNNCGDVFSLDDYPDNEIIGAMREHTKYCKEKKYKAEESKVDEEVEYTF